MGRKKARRGPGHSSGPEAAVKLGSLTHVGMKRSGNEDSYCALVGPNSPPGTDSLMAVADGMGGHQSGEVASALAITELVSRLNSDGGEDATIPSAGRHDAQMQRVVQEVNAEVNRAATRPDTRGMGTTLTSAMLVGTDLFLAHVGDSRAYLSRKGKLRQLTQDHSWVAEEVARGTLTPQQARDHPRKNVLTRALGIAPDVQVDTMRVELEEGDLLLLCSDGLNSLVTDDEIGLAMSKQDPQEACESLVDRANSLGGHDNITVVIARMDRLSADGGVGEPRKDIHEMATKQIHGSRSAKRGIGKTILRILLLPLWLPVWILVKLLRVAFRRRK